MRITGDCPRADLASSHRSERLEVGKAESALTVPKKPSRASRYSPGEEPGVYSNNSEFQQKRLKSTGMMTPPLCLEQGERGGETSWELLRDAGDGGGFHWSGGGVAGWEEVNRLEDACSERKELGDLCEGQTRACFRFLLD